METEENKVPSQENPIESSIRQEMELYSQLYPDPKSPVEVIANYQHVINNLTFKMNEELAKLRLEFLEETVGYYNSSNRGINKDTKSCSYEHGCAIGRKLDKELCLKLDSFTPNGVSDHKVFELLPDDLKVLGQYFLMDIQNLHDASSYWNDKGLSEMGEDKVREIKINYSL